MQTLARIVTAAMIGIVLLLAGCKGAPLSPAQQEREDRNLNGGY